VKSQLGIDGWLKVASSAAAAVAVATYTCLYVLLDAFYGDLGVQPEEVGFSYGNLIVRSLALAVLLWLPVILIFGLYAYLRAWIAFDVATANLNRHLAAQRARLLPPRSTATWPETNRRFQKLGRLAARWVPILLTLLLLVGTGNVLSGSLALAHGEASNVRLGFVSASLGQHIGPFPFVPYAAQPLLITWQDPPDPQRKALLAHRLLYLGGGQSDIVAFDATTDEVLRLPRAAMISRVVACGHHHSKAAPCETPASYAPGADLSGASLRDANLVMADFSGANIDRGDLRGAVLFRATLSSASLVGAKLNAAILSAAAAGNANFSKADAVGADFSKASLGGTDFKDAHLSFANFSHSDLRGANLQGANLSGAALFGANLDGANLSGSDLTAMRYDESTKWPTGFVPPVPPS
jgi:Pentapeptide repeats (8 copies)